MTLLGEENLEISRDTGECKGIHPSTSDYAPKPELIQSFSQFLNIRQNQLRPLCMLSEIKLGQKITLNQRQFRVITVVNQSLVCLEVMESAQNPPGVWIMDYDNVLQVGTQLDDFGLST